MCGIEATDNRGIFRSRKKEYFDCDIFSYGQARSGILKLCTVNWGFVKVQLFNVRHKIMCCLWELSFTIDRGFSFRFVTSILGTVYKQQFSNVNVRLLGIVSVLLCN